MSLGVPSRTPTSSGAASRWTPQSRPFGERGTPSALVIGRDTGLSGKYTYELENTLVVSGVPVTGIADLTDIRRSPMGLEGIFWILGDPSIIFILAIPDSLMQRLAGVRRDSWGTELVFSARLTSLAKPLLGLGASEPYPEESPSSRKRRTGHTSQEDACCLIE